MTKSMKAIEQVLRNLQSRGITIARADAQELRRCEMTLQRWAEEECGSSDDYKSTMIERDETTGKPYRRTILHSGDPKGSRTPVLDREKGALKRAAAVCQRNNLYMYHQTDCRGVMLYVGKYPLNDQNYTNAAACNA